MRNHRSAIGCLALVCVLSMQPPTPLAAETQRNIISQPPFGETFTSLDRMPVEIAANTAPNPSFEQGSALPDGWVPKDSNATFTWSNTTARSGSRSVCISGVAASYTAEWGTVARLPVIPGRSYQMTTWAKGNLILHAQLGALSFKENGQVLNFQGRAFTFSSNEWTYATTTYLAEPDARWVELLISAINLGPYASGTVCFDDVSWEEQTSSVNVPFFWQRDPRWRTHPLRSNGTCSAYCGAIGTCGCTLTSAAMLFRYYGALTTPAGSEMNPPNLSDCMGTSACPFAWLVGGSCSNGRARTPRAQDFSWDRLDAELNQKDGP
jgi:hypothetical protein